MKKFRSGRAWMAVGLVAVVSGAVIAVVWLEHYWWAGGFRTVTPHFAGSCELIKGVPSPEDLTIDQSAGIAYISSYDRIGAAGEARPGAIVSYDLGQSNPHPISLTPGADETFLPHGISLYRGPNGSRWLFVINHGKGDGSAVEVYRVDEGRLALVRTVRDPLLTSPNNIVAVGPEQFYLTNSRRHAEGIGSWIESTFRMSWGSVIYFDGKALSPVIPKIAFPNGINVSRDGEDVYVASSFDQAVHVYQRDSESGFLEKKTSVHVGTRLDNVEVDGGGDLWVAARARYLDDPQPAQVLRIQFMGGGEARVEEVYVNDGGELGRASVAAAFGRHLLIGSSRSAGFLHCVMDQ